MKRAFADGHERLCPDNEQHTRLRKRRQFLTQCASSDVANPSPDFCLLRERPSTSASFSVEVTISSTV